MTVHQMEGRLCGAYDPPTGKFTTIVVCSCGLSFIGLGVDEADAKWLKHREAISHQPA